MGEGRLIICLVLTVILILEFNHAQVNGLRANRTRRQTRTSATSAAAVLPWQRIYVFSLKLAKAFGNNALLSNLNDMITTEMGKTSKAYCGGRGGYGYGGGGGGYGYGGYSYAQQPIIYYVQQPQEVVFDTGITDFTSGFGGAVGNDALLEQLIALIQSAIDDTYADYESDGTPSK